MKAALFYGVHDLKLKEIERPNPSGHEVLIHNEVCGICGTDIHIYNGEKGSAEVCLPVVLGHEYSGEIIKIGDAVTSVRVGDRVSIDPNIYCGKCPYCKIGKKQMCTKLCGIGVSRNGGFAQYSVVPETQCFTLGDSISYEAGAMAEPLACCIHGIDQASIRIGDIVCVVGGGTIGLLLTQLVKASGAAQVVLSEPVKQRREMGLVLGADVALAPSDGPLSEQIQKRLGVEGADVVIECAGNYAATQQAFEAARHGATILLFSVPHPDATYELSLFDVFKKELTIRGSFINPDTHQRAVDMINSRKIQVDSLITHRYTLGQLEDAIHKQTDPDSIKVVVELTK